MEAKKSHKANLEETRFLFLEIGFVLALSAVVIAFEWTSKEHSFNEYETVVSNIYEEEIIPVTIQKEQKIISPPKPEKIVEIFEIVKNEVEIDDEFQLEDFEVNQETEIEIIEYTDYEGDNEVGEEEEIFFIVEDMPCFGGKDANGFREYISENLKYPTLAAENGISGRVFVKFVVEPDGSVSDSSDSIFPQMDTWKTERKTC